MAPKHPVPSGYGHPCDTGEFVPQGTSSGKVIYAYEEIEDDLMQDDYRNARTFDNDNMYDHDC